MTCAVILHLLKVRLASAGSAYFEILQYFSMRFASTLLVLVDLMIPYMCFESIAAYPMWCVPAGRSHHSTFTVD